MILVSVNTWLAGWIESAIVHITVGPVEERGVGMKEGLRVETLEMGLE